MSLDIDTQELVDEYLAAGGKITVCPPRTFAIDAAEKIEWARGMSANARASERAAKLRSIMADLRDQGMDIDQIAAKVGRHRDTVREGLRRFDCEAGNG